MATQRLKVFIVRFVDDIYALDLLDEMLLKKHFNFKCCIIANSRTAFD